MFKIQTLKRKNSRKYTPIKDIETIDGVVEYMKEKDLSYAGSPYFFTHVKLSDGSIVTENVQGFTCSPQKLRDRLQGKENV